MESGGEEALGHGQLPFGGRESITSKQLYNLISSINTRCEKKLKQAKGRVTGKENLFEVIRIVLFEETALGT